MEDYLRFSLAHDGPCFKKSSWSSAAAEEYEAPIAATALLFHPDGTPRDADTAIFASTIVADNDTRGPNTFMAKQNEIMGSVADNKAQHVPDLGHCIKGNSNATFKLRDKDSSFKEKYALSNVRIKSIQADISRNIKAYHPNVGDSSARKQCLDQLKAIIPHHCGDHSRCSIAKFCKHAEVKQEHPEFSTSQIKEEAFKRTKRHGGSTMDLSKDGQQVLTDLIFKRFNEDNIDIIAKCGCSNQCEAFWGQSIKYSKGKRILGCQTDLWYTML